ncbi:DNA-binding protein HU [bacterium]|nr:DNA-binding protein HU [bacterium]|tara:strand:- start:6922 stop:7191 length:270 start_codon:yes stop_codon:yes gene_type:complete
MTKDELLEKLSGSCCSKKEAGECLDAFTNIVTEALKADDKIALTGFGTFSISKRKARQGVNPRTGEKLQIPAMNVPKFKAGKALKDAVR